MPEAGSANLIEIIWTTVEVVGFWFALRLWRSVHKQERFAEYYRTQVKEPADILEAEAMIAIASDRERRNGVLLMTMASGVFLGVWAMVTPPPARVEVQAFSFGAAAILILRDGMYIWTSIRSYNTGEHVAGLLAKRTSLLSKKELLT